MQAESGIDLPQILSSKSIDLISQNEDLLIAPGLEIGVCCMRDAPVASNIFNETPDGMNLMIMVRSKTSSEATDDLFGFRHDNLYPFGGRKRLRFGGARLDAQPVVDGVGVAIKLDRHFSEVLIAKVAKLRVSAANRRRMLT